MHRPSMNVIMLIFCWVFSTVLAGKLIRKSLLIARNTSFPNSVFWRILKWCFGFGHFFPFLELLVIEHRSNHFIAFGCIHFFLQISSTNKTSIHLVWDCLKKYSIYAMRVFKNWLCYQNIFSILINSPLTQHRLRIWTGIT